MSECPALAELLASVQALPCHVSRELMRRTLRRLKGQRVYIAERAIVAPDRLALAMSILADHTVAETRDAIIVRLQCDRSTAYRLITAALQARKPPQPGAQHD